MNRASPSFHSFACRSKLRGVLATVKLATATPDCVWRSSGSAVRLPTMVRVVSFIFFTPVPYGLHLSGETPSSVRVCTA
jgi:hypothetical protein